MRDFGHRIALYNTSVLPFGNDLEAIYIEKCFDGSGKENELKEVLELELRASGLNVPVYIRKDRPLKLRKS